MIKKIYDFVIKKLSVIPFVLGLPLLIGVIAVSQGWQKLAIAIFLLEIVLLAICVVSLIASVIKNFRLISDWDENYFSEIDELALHYKSGNEHDLEIIAMINFIYRDSDTIKSIIEGKNYQILFKRYVYLSNKLTIFDEFINVIKSIIVSIFASLLVCALYSTQAEINNLYVHIFAGALILIFFMVLFPAEKIKENPGYDWILQYEKELLEESLREIAQQISISDQQKACILEKQKMLQVLIKKHNRVIRKSKKRLIENKILVLESLDPSDLRGNKKDVNWEEVQNRLSDKNGLEVMNYINELKDLYKNS
jgi:hypothetical protein